MAINLQEQLRILEAAEGNPALLALGGGLVLLSQADSVPQLLVAAGVIGLGFGSVTPTVQAATVNLVQPRNIGLVEDQHRRLVREEPLGRMEELALCLDGVSALLRKIDEVENANQVCERRDTLHLNVVHLLQRVVDDTRRVDHQPSHVAVIEVPHEERLGRERIRLDVDVRVRDLPLW